MPSAQERLMCFAFLMFFFLSFQYSIKTRYIPGFIDKVIKDLRVDPTQSTVRFLVVDIPCEASKSIFVLGVYLKA